MFVLLALLCLPASAVGAEPVGAAQRLHDSALAHLRRRELPAAARLLAQLSASPSASAYASLVAGHCALLGRGEVARAEAAYRAGIAAAVGDAEAADAAHALGRLFRTQNKWAEADAYYSEVRVSL